MPERSEYQDLDGGSGGGGVGSRVVLLGCGVIGVGMLLPMNFYFNADAYWKYKWRVIGNSTQSFDLGQVISSNQSCCEMRERCYQTSSGAPA